MTLLIGEKIATLKELETYYSYEDALNLAEVLMVKSHNERMAYKAAERKR